MNLREEEEGAWAGHLQALKAAGTDQTAFNAAHAALGADKSVSKEHMARISRSYGVGVSLGSTRKAHHEEIGKTFIRRARFENKLK